MTELWERFVHPTELHAWRWRLLCVWIVLFSVIVGVLLDQHHDQAMKAERSATQARITNARQQAVLVQVCNRGYILLGLVEVSMDVVREQLRFDQGRRSRLAEADEAFLRRFDVAHAEIIEELTAPTSPCVLATTR